MTQAIIIIVSAVGLAVLFKSALKILPFRFCAVCAGVFLTWIWILAGVFMGFLPLSDWLLPAGILMGGSAVGAAYRLEKKFGEEKFNFRRKIFFMVFSFAAVFRFLETDFVGFLIFLALAGLTGLDFLIFGWPAKDDSSKAKELEEKMKNCC